jgi:protein-S-isoprenylcysteine O-methyltransferase Ste14
MITYETVIGWSWAALVLVWAVAAFTAKRDLRRGNSSAQRSQYWLVRLGLAAAVVIASLHSARTGARPLLARSLFVPPPFLGWFGAALAVLGVAFAIWARLHLGRNWSPAPAMKEGHELVTSGPYAFVRHPIYTGILCAVLGATLSGSLIGAGLLGLVSVVFASRIVREERIMLELFPNTYPAYQARTKRLIPFVW